MIQGGSKISKGLPAASYYAHEIAIPFFKDIIEQNKPEINAINDNLKIDRKKMHIANNSGCSSKVEPEEIVDDGELTDDHGGEITTSKESHAQKENSSSAEEVSGTDTERVTYPTDLLHETIVAPEEGVKPNMNLKIELQNLSLTKAAGSAYVCPKCPYELFGGEEKLELHKR